MFKKLLMGVVASLAIAATLAAQGGGGGGMDGEDPAGAGVRAATRFENFTNRLKMDRREQVPLVTPILEKASAEAAPVAQQMAQLQTQLINAYLQKKTDAEIRPLLDAYTTTAAEMTGIEAKAFAEIYALLKPNQQSGAVQAFDMMAGWFQPTAAGRAGGGRAGRGGGR